MDHLTIATYNCKGLGSAKYPLIRKLLATYDIVMLQETWLFSEQSSQLLEIGNSIGFCAASGMDSDQPLVGRPHGGVDYIMEITIKRRC